MNNPASRSVTAAMACLMLAACAPELVRLPVNFDAQEAANLLQPGTNRIAGTILYEPDRGRALGFPDTFVSCAGREVMLIPYTDYAREWALRYYGKPVTDIGYRLANRGNAMRFEGQEAFLAATRKTECDDKGNFAFDRVANGDFLIVAKVQWLGKDEESYQFGFAPEDIDEEDGSVVKKITLRGNEKRVLGGPWP
ncbi:hypothetical protein [Methyloparacoccus murrellii]